MSATNVRPVPDDFATQAHIDAETYERMYRHSIEHPDEFWAKEAELFLAQVAHRFGPEHAPLARIVSG